MANESLPTQKFVEVESIKDGVLYLRGGGMRQVLIVSGVNFDLKSEAEQTLILNSFQNFINTLDFSVQFFIHSRKVNVEAYLKSMEARREEEPSELLKIQIEEYIHFIRTFVEQNAIVSKTFFVIVPYDPISIGAKGNGILSLFRSSTPKQATKETANEENLEQLNHRVDEVLNGLDQIGLRAIPLNDEELTELFYNLYNPQLVEKKGLEITKQ